MDVPWGEAEQAECRLAAVLDGCFVATLVSGKHIGLHHIHFNLSANISLVRPLVLLFMPFIA